VSQIALPPELTKGLEGLEWAFPGRVSVESDEAGAVVHLAAVELPAGWSPAVGVLSFLLPFHYPDAAIYPYYMTETTPAASVGGGALQQVSWRGVAATQVSLRHSGWDPARDTALGSVLATMAWLRRG
jgi:hypothetical protein